MFKFYALIYISIGTFGYVFVELDRMFGFLG